MRVFTGVLGAGAIFLGFGGLRSRISVYRLSGWSYDVSRVFYGLVVGHHRYRRRGLLRGYQLASYSVLP